MIQRHYHPGNASMTPHIVLEELGVPFELKLVYRARGAHKSAEYLRLNPNGLIPVLVDGDLVLYETAAIVLHLVDAHPAAGLAPAVGTAERAQFYKWLVWLAASLQAQMPLYFYAERHVADGNADGAAQVKARAEERIAADPYAFMLCRWTRGMRRPARTLAHVGPYLQRVLARLAVQRAIATEQLPPPLV